MNVSWSHHKVSRDDTISHLWHTEVRADRLVGECLIVKGGEAVGGEYMQSIDGRPKRLLMSENNRGGGTSDIWLGRKRCPPYVTEWHNPTYEHMHACYQ